MTIVCGFCDDERAVLAADSMAVDGNGVCAYDVDKIIKRRDYAIGCSGSYYLNQQLDRRLRGVEDCDVYAIADIVREVSADAMKPDSHDEPLNALVVCRDGLYQIFPSGAAVKRRCAAIGSGYEIAMGAMDTLYRAGSSPGNIVDGGAGVAIRFNAYCGGVVYTAAFDILDGQK